MAQGLSRGRVALEVWMLDVAASAVLAVSLAMVLRQRQDQMYLHSMQWMVCIQGFKSSAVLRPL